MPCLERFLDVYFNNDITDIVVEMQKEPLLQISIVTCYTEVIEEFLDDQFPYVSYEVTSEYIGCIILNYLGMYWEDTPCKYTAFDNGFNPSCDFKYGNMTFSIQYKPDLEYYQEFANHLKNNEFCDLYFKRIGPPGGPVTKLVTYNRFNKIYKHQRHTPNGDGLSDTLEDDEKIVVTYEKQLSNKERLEIADEFQRFIDQCKRDIIEVKN